MNRYDPTDTMEEVRHGSYVLFEDAQKRIAELEAELLLSRIDNYKLLDGIGEGNADEIKVFGISEGGTE